MPCLLCSIFWTVTVSQRIYSISCFESRIFTSSSVDTSTDSAPSFLLCWYLVTHCFDTEIKNIYISIFPSEIVICVFPRNKYVCILLSEVRILQFCLFRGTVMAMVLISEGGRVSVLVFLWTLSGVGCFQKPWYMTGGH